MKKVSMKKINNLVLKTETDTEKGKLIFERIVRMYTTYTQIKKYKPNILKMGINQKEIYEQDKKLQELLKDGKIEFTEKQSELSFK